VFHRRGVTAAQHYVPAIAERPLRNRRVEVEPSRQQAAAALVRDRVEDWIVRNQRVAGEVHLRHEPAGERWPEQREVDVRRSPRVGVVAPGVRAWLDRDEPVAALPLRTAAARAAESYIREGKVVAATVT